MGLEADEQRGPRIPGSAASYQASYRTMSFQREVRRALRFGTRASRFFSAQPTQRGKATTKSSFFASLRITCHPDRSEGSAFLHAPLLPRSLRWALIGATLVVALASTQARPQGPPLPDSCLKEPGASTQIRNFLQTLETHPSAEAFNTVGALWAQDRKYDCAIAAFDAALRLDPTVWDARYNKGLALVSVQNYEQAVKELHQAVKEKPGSFAAHNALGRALRSLGQPAEATDEFKKALGLNPRFVDASLNLADIALDQKRYVAAAYYVQQALSKSPPQPFSDRLEMDLAMAYSGNQEYEKAAGVFKKLVAAHPDSSELHFDLANTYAHYNEWDPAAAEYKQTLRLDPKNDAARLSLAKAYISLNQVSETLPYLRDYVSNQPRDAEGYEIEGEVYRKLGQFGEAVAALRKAVAMNPQSYQGHYNLGFCLARLGQTDEGIEQLKEAAKIKPAAPEPAYELGLLLSKKDGTNAGQGEFDKFQQVKQENQRNYRADTLNEQGNKAMREGRWRDAVEDYNEALRLNPGDAPYYFNVSLAYSKLGDRGAEEAALAKAVQVDPKLAKAHNQLGLRFMEDGKLADAEKELKAALEVDPHYAEAESNLGVLYARQGKNSAAEALFQKAQEDDPQYAQAFVNLGLVLGSEGKLRQAAQQFQAALKLSPDNPTIYTDLGMTEGKLGHGKEAVEIFRKVVQLQPASATAHLNLGIALADHYDLQGALAQFSEAARLDPGSAAAHCNKGRALYDLGKHEEARAELEKACSINPNYPEALYLLAQAERRLGDMQKSVDFLERLVKLAPGNAEAQALLGQDLLRLGKTDEAIEHLQLAVKSDPNNTQALYNLADQLAKSGRPEAKEYMTRFNELEKQRQLTDRVQKLGNFGLEAASARNWTQALEDLKQALELCGNCRFGADLHRNLGLVYLRTGDTPDGTRELEVALKLNPDDDDARKALEAVGSVKVN